MRAIAANRPACDWKAARAETRRDRYSRKGEESGALHKVLFSRGPNRDETLSTWPQGWFLYGLLSDDEEESKVAEFMEPLIAMAVVSDLHGSACG